MIAECTRAQKINREREMRILTERPLNAETPAEALRSWITANSVFFHRNQSELKKAVSLVEWKLSVEGEVESPSEFTFDELLRLPKAIVANTLECSGNGRSLFREKASGNPWTIGGVGNAVWGGVWLKALLQIVKPKGSARHVAFEGMDEPYGAAKLKFIRSIPLEKALTSTLLAYEMNGEPPPLEHGFPLRVLALGWTGANCCKWLKKIMVLDRPYEGHYMDRVYRVFQKGQDSKSGTVVNQLPLKSFITQPLPGESLKPGKIVILGTAYGGERTLSRVDVSADGGRSWSPAEFIGPNERFAWRQWQYVWTAEKKGAYCLMARAMDSEGNQQPMEALWNVLGYGNNGVHGHAIPVFIV
jgi:DMSO/TMAO reductase YedYZ molybdopterin-dependent catalytic subunit